MLAAYRKLREDQKSGKWILIASFSIIILIIFGVNFDLRVGVGTTTIADRIAMLIAQAS